MVFITRHTFCTYKFKNAIRIYLTDMLTYFFAFFNFHEIWTIDIYEGSDLKTYLLMSW